MKLIRKGAGRFDMVLDQDEWEGFNDVLAQYPRTPADHHSLTSADSPDPALKDSDQWLKESASMHQGERGKQLQDWLKRVQKDSKMKKKTYRVSLDPSRSDWLIEILNDIRIGNWLDLGCPEPEALSDTKWSQKDWPKLWSMEMAGMYQSVLLKCMT